MTLKLRHFYEFGPFRLEPDEQLLVSNSQTIPLAPKYFELLVFLVQNCGRLVTKEQIMQTVWAGSFVEDANLTVAISAIRKALGEKETKVRYIETVPKKGYRFTEQVRKVEESPTATTAQNANPISPHLDELSVKEGEPGSASAQHGRDPTGTPASIGLDDRLRKPIAGRENEPGFLEQDAQRSDDRREVSGLRLGQRRIIKPALVLFGVAVLLGYALYLKQAASRRLLGEPRNLAILPLQNLKPDVDSDFLGFSLADALITKLDYVSSLSVRPSAAVAKYRNQIIDIQKVAADLKADTLLTGSFVREGENFRVTYQLIDVKTNKLLGRGTIDLKYDNLLQVQDRVAQQILKDLELNLSPSEAERIKPDAPVKPLAYEFYLRGVDLHGQHKFPMAIKMLEKSTEIDPNYAPAWAFLGASYTSDAAFEFGGREQYRRARAAYERALTIQPGLLEAQVFLANLLIDTGKVEQAVTILRNALKTNPNNADVEWELGYAYRFAGMLKESVAECERARQIDPLVKANGSVLNSYLYLGEYDKFLRSLPEANDSAFLLFYHGFGEYYRKNWGQAARDFDRAFALDPTLYTQIGKALSDSIMHRNADGLEILRSLEKEVEDRGVGDPEGTYKIAQAYSALGDKVSGLRVLRSSVESGFFSYPYLATDPLLDSIRMEPEFRDILNAADLRHRAFKAQFF